MRLVSLAGFFGLSALMGCLGPESPPIDAGPDAACGADSDCDDDVYCNGAERCVADEAGAWSCIAGTPPCADECVESERRCEGCVDADGDGAADAACGGTDCNDSDEGIHPGATEVCDSEGVDEDCDPSTLGHDLDGDGFVDATCCNGDVCGTDCNDAVRNANPDAPEVCNGSIDDDCDGSVDEGVTETFYRDVDGDNYGDPTMTMQGCSAPEGWTVLCCDCNDRDPRFNPAATELCMPPGADEDCDDAIDEGCDCTFAGSRACGPGAPFAGVGVCRDGSQTCSSAGTLSECMGAVSPSAEVCNGLDDDCNGEADESFACEQNASVPGTTACGRPGVRRCSASCAWLDPTFLATAEVAASCDYCADTAGGFDSELAFATGSQQRHLTSGMSQRLLGDAFCTVNYMGNCGATRLHSGTSAASAGASYLPSAVEVGYGELVATVSATVRTGASPPRHGVGVVFARATGGPLYSGAGADLGAPTARDGWVAEYRFHDAIAGTEEDVIRIRQLRATGSDPHVGSTLHSFDRVATNVMGGVSVSFTVRVRPDDPRTAANETRVRVEQSGLSAECGGATCGNVIRPGDTLEVGVTSSGGDPGRSEVTLDSLRLDVPSLCP